MKADSLSFKTKFWIESVIKPYINFYRIDHKNEIITFYIYADVNDVNDAVANVNANVNVDISNDVDVDDAVIINPNKTSINHMNTNSVLISDLKVNPNPSVNTNTNSFPDQSKNLLSFTIVKKSMHFAQANLLIDMGEISERYLRLLLITYLTKSINDFRSLIKLLHIPHQTIEYKLMSPTPLASFSSSASASSSSSSFKSKLTSSANLNEGDNLSSSLSSASTSAEIIAKKILQESTPTFASTSTPILESKENQNLLTNDAMNKDSLPLQTPLSPTFGQNDEIKIFV